MDRALICGIGIVSESQPIRQSNLQQLQNAKRNVVAAEIGVAAFKAREYVELVGISLEQTVFATGKVGGAAAAIHYQHPLRFLAELFAGHKPRNMIVDDRYAFVDRQIRREHRAVPAEDVCHLLDETVFEFDGRGEVQRFKAAPEMLFRQLEHVVEIRAHDLAMRRRRFVSFLVGEFFDDVHIVDPTFDLIEDGRRRIVIVVDDFLQCLVAETVIDRAADARIDVDDGREHQTLFGSVARLVEELNDLGLVAFGIFYAVGSDGGVRRAEVDTERRLCGLKFLQIDPAFDPVHVAGIIDAVLEIGLRGARKDDDVKIPLAAENFIVNVLGLEQNVRLGIVELQRADRGNLRHAFLSDDRHRASIE